ncbi:response regulator [Alsobacter sp. SYSU M60028]|uniref:Response regulator n=1 Tax=Alsobacter ponti TaxID=2962936 RepID=A0ABT1LII4_9HYPH|nr:response regulator [Alsobacter ponti]
MIGDYLMLHGFRVSLCDGGAGLRELMARDAPDLVILDLNMPGEDGLSIIRWMKQTDSVPVIMLTATASAIDRVVGLELGADDYLTKPCELRELLARVRSVLRRLRWVRSGQTERRLAAIVSFDIVGFSRLVQEDEPRTLASVDAVLGQVIAPKLSRRNGTLFKMLGDGALIDFMSVVDAIEWAVDFQSEMVTRPVPPGRIPLEFRVGIAVGDIVVNNNDRFGEGVALAVRVQEMCAPGGLTVSDYAHQLVRGKIDANFADTGLHQLKNIVEPMRIWAWAPPAA